MAELLKIMDTKIFVIGHKSPDLDSVVAAISYAGFKNQQSQSESYVPAVAGPVNPLTKFVLDRFSVSLPVELKQADNKQLVLVDHNEESQQVEGENKEIVEILDHHKINLSLSGPIRIEIEPLGSTNSIIFKKYQQAGVEISPALAGLMLSAILDDTVITKSPTCTPEDEKIILLLSKLAGIEDWQNYGIEMFKAKANVGAMSEQEIIKLDFKDFAMKAGKIGIGQVETVDLADFADREDALLSGLEKLLEEGAYHSVVLFITDIIKGGSKFLVATKDQEKIESALGARLENGKAYVDGIVSRKKQVVPKFSEILDQ